MRHFTKTVCLGMVFTLAATLLIAGVGCTSEPKYVRDEDEPRLDEYTMSMRLDRRDLDRLYEDNIHQLLNSEMAREWDRARNSPNVAIFPMRNETSEHIDDGLDALLTRFETDLVNRSAADVISHRDQPELIEEVERQQHDAYDPAEVVQYGRQMGAQYFVTGRVYDVAERVDDQRRVQYFMFVQVINVETGQVGFQHESNITKGLIR